MDTRRPYNGYVFRAVRSSRSLDNRVHDWRQIAQRHRLGQRSEMVASTALERHYRVKELVALWGFSRTESWYVQLSALLQKLKFKKQESVS